ncbi:MAG: aldo/keto reductase [Candidatus Lokiarchaeota archaeon]|nr:aldo/keto reductase [Candidatus Lokiarchaeota archaeon]
MKNYATPSGTSEYKDLMKREKNIHADHFRRFETLELSSLGMGTYLGKPKDYVDQLVIDAVIKSIQNGINIIDTAINYRHQKAERSIRIALEKLNKMGFTRDQIFISTKNGYIPGDADEGLNSSEYIKNVVLKNDLATSKDIINYNCTTIPYLNHQLDQSLENLGISTIDLLYLHNVAESQKETLGDARFYEMMEKCFSFLENKIDDQKIRFYGMATWTCFRLEKSSPSYINLERIIDIAEKAAKRVGHKSSGFKFVMLPYNLLMQEAATLRNQDGKTFFQKARELNIGVFTAVPLLQGKLLRTREIKELQIKWDLNSPAQAAIQYVRSFGIPLIAPLVGQKQPEHVEENLEIVRIPPSEDIKR